MSSHTLTIPYRCDNDCLMEGCPGHEAKLNYQSTSDHLSFEDGQNTITGFDLNKMTALLEGVAQYAQFRVEINGVLNRAGLVALDMESDHTPEASTNIGAQGDTNLTQPSGEQPTSVDLKEKYEDYALKLGQRRGERTYEITEKTLDDLIAEERRQAKIELWELLIGKEAVNDPSTIPDDFIQVPWSWIRVQLSKLRGENNE